MRSFITAFKIQHIPVDALALLIWVRSHILLELIKMSVRDAEFEGHPAAHFDIILHHCDEAVLRRFLRPSELLGEFFALFKTLA